MCRKTFRTQPEFRRHLREIHPGYTLNRDRRHLQLDEIIAGQNALKRWVRNGHWKKARYVHEPRRIDNESLIYRYATACERIASEDQDFTNKFGTKFHRQDIGKQMESKREIWPGRKSLKLS
jgi:hypothetical protein